MIDAALLAARALANGSSCKLLVATDRSPEAVFARMVRQGSPCTLHTFPRRLSATPAEHGKFTGRAAMEDLMLLSYGHHLVGTWQSTFSVLIQELIAHRQCWARVVCTSSVVYCYHG